jgi:hypothetical protein
MKDKKKESKFHILISNLLNSKQFKNSILIMFIVIFVGGYTIFFTSPLYMPTDFSEYKITELNKPQQLDNNHSFTISRWQYSEEQQRMEIELDIQNTAYDGIKSYTYNVRTDPSSRTTVTRIIEDSSLVILQIDNVSSNFKILSLQISLPNDNDNILKLYTNPKSVEQADNIQILSRMEYQIQRLQRNIVSYQDTISQLENEIATKKVKISNIEAQNKELTESRFYKTNAEIQQIDTQIQDNVSLIETEQKAIQEMNAEILEYQNKITLIQEQIADLK